MPLDIATTRASIVAEIRVAKPPASSFDPKSYLGSPIPVLGLSVPQLRAILSKFSRDHRDLRADEVNALAAAMWSGSSFEEKTFAMSLLVRYRKILDDASWSLADRWADEVSGWGLCDTLGMGPVASMVYDRPARFRDLLRWARSENPWRRRVAAYGLRDLVYAKDFDRPLRLLERLLYDREFWVQRAVGTWLRECWKRDRRRTEAFLRKHVRGLPPVVITVATERAPKAFREELRRKAGVRDHAPRSRAGPPARRRRRRA